MTTGAQFCIYLAFSLILPILIFFASFYSPTSPLTFLTFSLFKTYVHQLGPSGFAGVDNSCPTYAQIDRQTILVIEY